VNAATRRAVVLLATLAAVALTARLGVWQLDRAGQKQALQDSLRTRGALPPLAGEQLAHDAGQAAAQHDRRIVLAGRWLPERTVFLENRQMDGRPGFFVLTPLLLVPGDAVLVQRGWTPRDPQDRARLPEVPTPAGEVRVEGSVAPPPSKLYAFVSEEHGRLRQNLDVDTYAREIGVALRPLSVRQQTDAEVPDGLLRHWPVPTADIDKHHGYAFQWFALSLLLTGLYVWFQLLAPWRERRRARR
jgi:surfeit locus 1 family protein